MNVPDDLKKTYSDIYTLEVLSVLSSPAHFNPDIKEAMTSRLKRREDCQKSNEKIIFLDPDTYIPRTKIKVQDSRSGNFEGAIIPIDLQRQSIQGAGPAAKLNSSMKSGIRNVAYALLSGGSH